MTKAYLKSYFSLKVFSDEKNNKTKQKIAINKRKRLFLDNDSFLHNHTDSLINAIAATNQNNVLSSAIAIKVISAIPTQIKMC